MVDVLKGTFLTKVLAYSVLAVMTLTVEGAGSGIFASSARGETCVNESIRSQEIYSQRLPDCRAYEQVSPSEKKFTDAVGAPGVTQASPSGQGVTFFSLTPFPEAPGAGDFVTYLSARGEDGWSTQGLLPSSQPASVTGVLGLTGDLSEALISSYPNSVPLALGAVSGILTYYLWDSKTGAYRTVTSSPEFGEVYLAGSTPDGSIIIFESTEPLVQGVTPKVPNLYEFDLISGQLSLVGVLPKNEIPSHGTVAGPGGPAIGARSPGGATSDFYTQGAISEDGSRVFFSDIETGRIYARINREKTIPLSPGTAYWRASTPDGHYVIYTEGEELYRIAVEGEAQPELLANGVVGTLGISDDGSYVYYVTSGSELYEWHQGTSKLITKLNFFTDENDWLGYCQCNGIGPAGGGKSSRVTSSPGGGTASVLFSASGHLDLYDAASGVLTCASCGQNEGVAYFARSESESAPGSRSLFLTHNLSENGSRVFFQTEASLVPQDSNGRTDVYEWEREGLGGGCQVGEGNGSGGCLYLISTGQSENSSYFGDASADGSDVFFFTRQSLVGQDEDNNNDLYDARVEGGIVSQNPAPSSVPCTGETCRGSVLESAPAFGLPSTATLSGNGNLMPSKKGRLSKPKKRKHKKGSKRAAKKGGLKALKGRHAHNTTHNTGKGHS